ncbi:Lantibiotic modifying enzyme [Chlamydia trachomatis]|nr:Lantibiotic modifying enzyme [Chlamydia trachomatis]
MWLNYLLNLSEDERPVDTIKTLRQVKTHKYIVQKNINNLFQKYQLDIESDKIISHLLSSPINDSGRLTKSNEFGEFVSPVSFQHGIGGILIYIARLSKLQKHSEIKKWCLKLNKEDRRIFLHRYSLLFGKAGYLWGILDLYEKNNDEYLYMISTNTVEKIISNYPALNEVDFALGKAGVLLVTMKYYSLFPDSKIELFIKHNITELSEKLASILIQENPEMSFAHGASGIAHVLYAYSKLFNDDFFIPQIEAFSNQLSTFVLKQMSNLEHLDQLELSWCEGISGLLLYLSLVNNEKYKKMTSDIQSKMVKNSLCMGTSFCHGLSSLLQTTIYNNNIDVFEQIKTILLSRSFRDEHDLLVFQSEDGKNNYFDFGIGTLGIYWVLLGNRFPFELNFKNNTR